MRPKNPLPIGSRRKTKKTKTEHYVEWEDLISKLPDDILIKILSLLTVEESVRCGTLSCRWATLPMLVPVLKIGSKYANCELPHEWEINLRIDEEEKFISKVNQILDSYRGRALDELSICFDLNMCYQPHIDKWVKFAMANKVKNFNLDLSDYLDGPKCYLYQFPPILYDQKRLRSRDLGLPRCTSFKVLRLDNVDVTGYQIEHFLEYCPYLESLCVRGTGSLISLTVDGPIRLKSLEIQYCYELQVLEISAPNLVSFKYLGSVERMPLKCAPQLKEMLIAHNFYNFFTDNFSLFTSYLSQLVTLSLSLKGGEEFRWPTGIPTLRNLKHLTIFVYIDCNKSLLCFSPWIEASPLLRRFVFKRERGYEIGRRKIVKPIMCRHQNLKEVEYVGFVGDVADTEFITYINKNAINLRKMVFDCRYPIQIGTPFEHEPCKKRSAAGVRAKKFRSMLSSAVEFVLIP